MDKIPLTIKGYAALEEELKRRRVHLKDEIARMLEE